MSEKLVDIEYYEQKVLVSEEVAIFLHEDDLYMMAQKKKEQRHWDSRRPEDIPVSEYFKGYKSVEDPP